MKLRVLNVLDVAEMQMCCGCGACEYISPGEVEMIDTLDHGRRPRFRNGAPQDAGSHEAMDVCPGIALEHTFDDKSPELISDLLPAWGPIREIWEGYACDPELRFMGSSGGAVSAIALYCLERSNMHGVLHIRARPDVPYLNHTVLSTTREDILAATGSRYAPASPCDGLRRIEEAPGPCVFIGKPCDVAATIRARTLRPKLDARLGLTIAFFCAGTPSTRGTLEMIRRMGIEDPSDVLDVRYRGMGWPGEAAVRFKTATSDETHRISYEESWGDILQKHRPWRCHVCADHTGEFADIAVGDPWYRPVSPDEPGRSLILARSERGRRLLHEALDAGYLIATQSSPDILTASQPSLLRARAAVWGRVRISALMGAAAPRYERMHIFRCWWSVLNMKEKAQSLYGTARRVLTKKLRQRVCILPYVPPPSSDSRDTSIAIGADIKGAASNGA